jgi:hypothetical protein
MYTHRRRGRPFPLTPGWQSHQIRRLTESLVLRSILNFLGEGCAILETPCLLSESSLSIICVAGRLQDEISCIHEKEWHDETGSRSTIC